jgi:hypothetical protein
MLFAMAYVRRCLGKEDVSPDMVKPYLNTVDMRQFTARMPTAIERGFVTRSLNYSDNRGYHYRLTNHGLTVLKEVGDWPYTVDHIELPAWVKSLSDR